MNKNLVDRVIDDLDSRINWENLRDKYNCNPEIKRSGIVSRQVVSLIELLVEKGVITEEHFKEEKVPANGW